MNHTCNLFKKIQKTTEANKNCNLDVHGSVHRSIIHKENPKKDATVHQNFISYLSEAQHVSGDTPPIIRRANRLGFCISGGLLDV
jgi:hypothetical protein